MDIQIKYYYHILVYMKMALSCKTINILSVAQILFVLATSESHYAIGRSLKGKKKKTNYVYTRYNAFPLSSSSLSWLNVPIKDGDFVS